MNFLKAILRALLPTPGVVIHEVEIRVSASQNPGRVARVVGEYLARDSRFRTTSPYSRGPSPTG